MKNLLVVLYLIQIIRADSNTPSNCTENTGNTIRKMIKTSMEDIFRQVIIFVKYPFDQLNKLQILAMSKWMVQNP